MANGGVSLHVGKKRTFNHGMRVALSYIVFLLICLALGVGLYFTSAQNARERFWQERMTALEQRVTNMDTWLKVMDGYARQLINDPTFVRFANMTDLSDRQTVLTANTIMRKLAERSYVIINSPILESHIYLKNLGYVISNIQFTELEQYYRAYRSFEPDALGEFVALLDSAESVGQNVDVSAITGLNESRFYMLDIDGILNRSVPAVVWFEWNQDLLRRLMLEYPESTETLAVFDDEGQSQLMLSGDGAEPTTADVVFDDKGFARAGDLRLLKTVSPLNGWTYRVALPESLCSDALDNYDGIFAALLLVAALAGGALVVGFVRRNMRPIHALNDKLEEAERDNAMLAYDLELQKPMVTAAYIRKLLSGHVMSQEEFSYIMGELGLSGEGLRFCVLYMVLFDQRSNATRGDKAEIIMGALPKYFGSGLSCIYYTTLDNEFVLLAAYDQKTADPLMDLQMRFVRMHESLIDEHSIWVSVGVGGMCTTPVQLWESYEQARNAARYTTENHIFLPYELMKKDSTSVYYPIELSAKLLHFITSGNRVQVKQLLQLIHRENIAERTLPDHLLSFLLSDIRNTLMKARFSIQEQTGERAERLNEADALLDGKPGFAAYEEAGQLLCGFFEGTAEPGNPIPEVQLFVREHYTDPAMCLSLLSARFNISESYLSHLFKEKIGQNFSVYLEDLRLNGAVRRLRQDKDCSLQNLYAELGYNNPVSFRRAFKKRFGITPSAMREQQRSMGQ